MTDRQPQQAIKGQMLPSYTGDGWYTCGSGIMEPTLSSRSLSILASMA